VKSSLLGKRMKRVPVSLFKDDGLWSWRCLPKGFKCGTR
jgi:hypothetical protein